MISKAEFEKLIVGVDNFCTWVIEKSEKRSS